MRCTSIGGESLKNGKRLKRIHKKLLNEQGYDCKDYLVTKDTSEFVEFVHRETREILLFRY